MKFRVVSSLFAAVALSSAAWAAEGDNFLLDPTDVPHCENALAHLKQRGRAVLCAFGSSRNVQETFNAQMEWLEERFPGVEHGELQVSRGDSNVVICVRVWRSAAAITD